MKCGREPGGANTRRHGVCPAATERKLNGVHGGLNGGRACWVVAGTLCGELPPGARAEGTHASQHETCKDCGFYRSVRDAEYPEFMLVGPLNKLKGSGD